MPTDARARSGRGIAIDAELTRQARLRRWLLPVAAMWAVGYIALLLTGVHTRNTVMVVAAILCAAAGEVVKFAVFRWELRRLDLASARG